MGGLYPLTSRSDIDLEKVENSVSPGTLTNALKTILSAGANGVSSINAKKRRSHSSLTLPPLPPSLEGHAIYSYLLFQYFLFVTTL